jgi:hypothetical protein
MNRCWTGKITYNTRLTAWRSALRMEMKYGDKQALYTCPYCHRFHLSTREGTVKGSIMGHKVGKKLNKLKVKLWDGK